MVIFGDPRARKLVFKPDYLLLEDYRSKARGKENHQTAVMFVKLVGFRVLTEFRLKANILQDALFHTHNLPEFILSL